MLKNLILHEELIENLEPLSNFSSNTLEECCGLVLKYLSTGQFLSQRSLEKASLKLDLGPDSLDACLKALAELFLQTIKQIKTMQKCQLAYEHFGIPQAELLAKFCFEQLAPIISMIRFLYPFKISIFLEK